MRVGFPSAASYVPLNVPSTVYSALVVWIAIVPVIENSASSNASAWPVTFPEKETSVELRVAVIDPSIPFGRVTEKEVPSSAAVPLKPEKPDSAADPETVAVTGAAKYAVTALAVVAAGSVESIDTWKSCYLYW